MLLAAPDGIRPVPAKSTGSSSSETLRPRMPRHIVIFSVACLRLRARPHLLPCPRPLLCTRPCPRLRVRPLIRIALFFVIPFSAVTVAIAVILSLTSLCPMFIQMIIDESIGEQLME